MLYALFTLKAKVTVARNSSKSISIITTLTVNSRTSLFLEMFIRCRCSNNRKHFHWGGDDDCESTRVASVVFCRFATVSHYICNHHSDVRQIKIQNHLLKNGAKDRDLCDPMKTTTKPTPTRTCRRNQRHRRRKIHHHITVVLLSHRKDSTTSVLLLSFASYLLVPYLFLKKKVMKLTTSMFGLAFAATRSTAVKAFVGRPQAFVRPAASVATRSFTRTSELFAEKNPTGTSLIYSPLDLSRHDYHYHVPN